MPFDPNYPQNGQSLDADPMRAQLNGLHVLIPTGAEIASFTIVDPGEPGSAAVELIGGVMRFSFSIPRGADGATGPEGPVGPAGEVTTAQLDAAIATTARNPILLTPLTQTISDPPTQAQVQAIQDAYNELLTTVQRPPA